MKVVPIEILGDVLKEFGGEACLAEDIIYLTPSGMRVRFAGKGFPISFSHVERIKSLDIDFVFLKHPLCSREISLVVDGDTRISLISLANDLRNRCAAVLDAYFSSGAQKLEYNFREHWQRYAGLSLPILQRYRKIMQDFVYLVRSNYTQKRVSPLPLPYTLTTFRSAHSINVALISGIIGLHYGEFNAERLFHLISGALLEDVGFVDAAWEMESPVWQEIYFKHSRIGCMLVNETETMSPQMGIIVLEHHRYVNNSGYPDDIPEKDFYGYPRQMHLYSKIVSVAETFDILRCFYPVHKVIFALRRFSGQLFDARAVDILSNYVSLYYIGEEVRLDDGRKAIVVAFSGESGYKLCITGGDGVDKSSLGQEIQLDGIENIAAVEGIDVKLRMRLMPLIHPDLLNFLDST